MNKIDINLASTKPRRAVFPYVLAAASFFLVVYTSYNAYSFFNNRDIIERYDKRMKGFAGAPQVDMRSDKESAQTAARDAEQQRRRVESINRIIARKTFSLSRLLTELEKRAPDGLYLVQISPDFSGQKITVSGVARSMNEVLQFVDRLSSSGSLKEVYLIKHSGTEKGNAAKAAINAGDDAVLFSISAGYVIGGVL